MLFRLIVIACVALCLGCSSVEEDLCAAECACEGCSDAKHAECLDKYDADEQQAVHEGCLGVFDDFLRCQDITGTCVGDEWKTSCKQEKDNFKHCLDDK